MIGPDSCDFYEKTGTELTNFAPFLTNFATSLVSFGASKVFFGANKVKSGADKTKGRAFKVIDASKDPLDGTELVFDAPKYPKRGAELVFDGPFSVLDGVDLVLSGPKDPFSVAESGGIAPGLRRTGAGVPLILVLENHRGDEAIRGRIANAAKLPANSRGMLTDRLGDLFLFGTIAVHAYDGVALLPGQATVCRHGGGTRSLLQPLASCQPCRLR